MSTSTTPMATSSAASAVVDAGPASEATDSAASKSETSSPTQMVDSGLTTEDEAESAVADAGSDAAVVTIAPYPSWCPETVANGWVPNPLVPFGTVQRGETIFGCYIYAQPTNGAATKPTEVCCPTACPLTTQDRVRFECAFCARVGWGASPNGQITLGSMQFDLCGGVGQTGAIEDQTFSCEGYVTQQYCLGYGIALDAGPPPGTPMTP